MAREVLDPALNAERLLDRCNTVKGVLKFLPMHHRIAQAMYVCLVSFPPLSFEALYLPITLCACPFPDRRENILTMSR
jgi:hypothetical protein